LINLNMAWRAISIKVFKGWFDRTSEKELTWGVVCSIRSLSFVVGIDCLHFNFLGNVRKRVKLISEDLGQHENQYGDIATFI